MAKIYTNADVAAQWILWLAKIPLVEALMWYCEEGNQFSAETRDRIHSYLVARYKGEVPTPQCITPSGEVVYHRDPTPPG
jgi:hypothetical protein